MAYDKRTNLQHKKNAFFFYSRKRATRYLYRGTRLATPAFYIELDCVCPKHIRYVSRLKTDATLRESRAYRKSVSANMECLSEDQL